MGLWLFVRQENDARQVVSLTAVVIATGYVSEDPFRIRGIRRKSVLLLFSASVCGDKIEYLIIRLLSFAAVASTFPFSSKWTNVTNLNELPPTRNGLLLRYPVSIATAVNETTW
ncbi:hypothetical protein AVEN_41040-1 [Araneus ventricosus]|uniref:Uncharacterized protein n=1 Tax=Araneus ventricosus TaxID=182803 RepID=A0A4Y2CKF5_ARAVE|nr:hypothetical protein AVEN_41040-1 [Araneus ventricosus]